MKKNLFLLAFLPLFLAGCSASEKNSTVNNNSNTPAVTENSSVETNSNITASDNDIVIYFSATGTTKGVAEKIQRLADSAIYEIVPEVPYTSEDLNYSNSSTRATREQRDDAARPTIGSERVDLTGYDTIYLGYPIWWGQAPKIMYTFVENYDFSNKIIKPFVTSSSSGVGSSARNLAKVSNGGEWKDGVRFSRSVSDSDITSWLAR